jgi:WD40 repeat protein
VVRIRFAIRSVRCRLERCEASRAVPPADGGLLATGGGDGTAGLWDPATGNCLRTLTSPSSEVVRVAFSPDGRLLAITSRNGMVQLWN